MSVRLPAPPPQYSQRDQAELRRAIELALLGMRPSRGVDSSDGYSPEEIDMKLAGKANVSHAHDAADITSGTLADDRLSSNIPRKDAGNIFTRGNTIRRPAASNWGWTWYVDGDTDPRLIIEVSGKLLWGAGTGGYGDTQLYRSAANSLRTPGAFHVGGLLHAEETFRAVGNIYAEDQGQLYLQHNSTSKWAGPFIRMMSKSNATEKGIRLGIEMPDDDAANGRNILRMDRIGSGYGYIGNIFSMDLAAPTKEMSWSVRHHFQQLATFANNASFHSTVNHYGSSATAAAMYFRQNGDEFGRLMIRYDGALFWGNGAANRVTWLRYNKDYELETNAALKVGGKLTAGELEVSGPSHFKQLATFANNASFNSTVNHYGPSATDAAMYFRQNGDALGRLMIRYDGALFWGNGTDTRDTFLYRAGGGLLKTDGIFDAGSLRVAGTEVLSSARELRNVTADVGVITSGRFDKARLPSTTAYTNAGNTFTEQQYIERPNATSDTALWVRQVGDSISRFRLRADGRMEWGTGGSNNRDTYLYRLAAGTLKTDGAFVAGGQIAAEKGVRLHDVMDWAPAGGNADVSLARTGSKTLTLDGNLKVVGALAAAGTPTSIPTVGAGGVTLDVSQAQSFVIHLDRNLEAIAIENVPYPATVRIRLFLTFAGSYTVTWPTSFWWPNGQPPVLNNAPERVELIEATTWDGGETWYAHRVPSNAYQPVYHNINAQSNNTNYGTVSGGGFKKAGTTASLLATASTGYQFVQWLENGIPVTDANPYVFTVTKARTLVAEFRPFGNRYITADVTPNGAGFVYGTGQYGDGATVSLWADPASGYTFSEWQEGGATVSTSNPYNFVVNGNRHLTAVFSPAGGGGPGDPQT